MANLSAAGRKKFNEFLAKTAAYYGGSVGHEFAATPSIEQALVEKIVEHGDWFMRYFTMLMVNEIKGEKVLMSLTKKTASRTAISSSVKRTTTNLLDTEDKGYELFQTNNDVNISYANIDAWAKFGPAFANLYNALLKKAMADDIITVGWHGTSHATTTDMDTNTMLEDVNIGWLQIMRAFNSGSNYSIGTTPSPIEIGGAAFPTLDSLVFDLRQAIPVHKRNNLVAYISDDLISAAQGTYYAANPQNPSEKVVVEQNKGTVLQTYGGMPAVTPPFFIESGILIAPRDALFHYTQSGSVRRTIRDAPESNGIDDFNSSNQGYVVMDEEAAFFCENITIAE